MADFLDRLVARSLHGAEDVSPRPVAMFEPFAPEPQGPVVPAVEPGWPTDDAPRAQPPGETPSRDRRRPAGPVTYESSPAIRREPAPAEPVHGAHPAVSAPAGDGMADAVVAGAAAAPDGARIPAPPASAPVALPGAAAVGQLRPPGARIEAASATPDEQQPAGREGIDGGERTAPPAVLPGLPARAQSGREQAPAGAPGDTPPPLRAQPPEVAAAPIGYVKTEWRGAVPVIAVSAAQPPPAAHVVRPQVAPVSPAGPIGLSQDRVAGERLPVQVPAPPAQAAPTIQVTIGRIEVRAVPPVPAPRQRPGPPIMTLDEYLRQRDGG